MTVDYDQETVTAATLVAPAALLRARGLSKAFGPTQALRGCSVDLVPGEVHAIIGENGSGKSTLVKLLAGVHRPDTGTLEIAGVSHPGLASPRAALAAGIATVFQEILVAGPRSVLDNVWLGADGLLRARTGRAEKSERAGSILADLLGEPPALEQRAEGLPVSARQACCIARAMARDPRILILDEATSALDMATRNRLFALLRRIAGQGRSVLFISHRMDEISQIADRVTVLRSGETVATLARISVSAKKLVQLMTGSDHLSGSAGQAAASRPVPQDLVLRATGLRLRPAARPFDFRLKAGEIIGVAGLEGQGQDAFLHAMRGAGRTAAPIQVKIAGQWRMLAGVRQAARCGIAYVPRERRDEALFGTLSITDNFAARTVRADTRAGLVSRRAAERRFREHADRLRIRIVRGSDPITVLSGGNQQKVILARWLAAQPRILLLNDPTRGVDLGAKREFYELLVNLARDGMAVVMNSTELDEHVELMDRVLVFAGHTLAAELGRGEATRQALVAAFFEPGSPARGPDVGLQHDEHPHG